MLYGNGTSCMWTTVPALNDGSTSRYRKGVSVYLQHVTGINEENIVAFELLKGCEVDVLHFFLIN